MADDTQFALKILDEGNLPEPIEDVAHFTLIMPEVVKAQKAEIQACVKMGMAKDIVDAKREDLNRANELLIEAKVRLGEFSRKLDREQGSRTSATGCQSQIRELGINPATVRNYEKMTTEAAEIEIQNARDEGRPPEQRKVIQIAEAIKERRLDNYLNSFTAYDESDKNRAELRGKLNEIEKRKKMSDAVDKPIRAVWAMPVTPEYIDCFIEYAYCTDSKNLKQHFQIIDESIEKLEKFKDVLKEKLIEKGNMLEVIN